MELLSTQQSRLFTLKRGPALVAFLFALGLALCPSPWGLAHAGVILNVPNYTGLNSGLVGFWSFDGKDEVFNNNGVLTSYDRSGQGNNGSSSNAVIPKGTVGKIGQALSFDGVNDYVDTGAGQGSELDLPGDLTICAWAYLRSVPNGSEAPIIANNGNDPKAQYSFEVELDRSVMLFWHDNLDAHLQTSAGLIAFNTWYHLCAVRIGSTAGTIYINGAAQATSVVSNGVPPANFGTAKIGRGSPNIDGTVQPFNGLIDDVRIYNRVLSADEVRRLYKIGGTLKLNKPATTGSLNQGLVGYWPFEDTDIAGVTAYDRSGNANNGTLTNGPQKTIGKIGQALTFDGTNDEVRTNANLTIGSNIATVSFWLNWAAYSDNSNQALTLGDIDNDNGSFSIMPNDAASQEFAVYLSSGAGTVRQESISRPSAGAWRHFAVILDNRTSAGDITVYLDGVLQATTLGSNTKNASGNFISTIFNMMSGGAVAFGKGLLDDLRVYNRALSADEIKRLYNLGGTFKVNKPANTGSLTQGLVGYWPFEDADLAGTDPLTAYDRSGNNNSATSTGARRPSRGVGKIGQALIFDGADDKLAASGSASLDNLTNKTISAWIYPRTFGGNSFGTVMISMNESNNASNWYLQLCNNDGSECTTNASTFVFATKWQAGGGDIEWTEPANTIKLNQWQHIAVVFNNSSSSNNPRFFHNGAEITPTRTTNTGSGAANSDSGFVKFIGNSNTNIPDFDGSIDDVRLYNRLLSADEIKRLYNMGTSR